MAISGYDIIGDIHGCANTLERLLRKLGYAKEDEVFYHPFRRVVFVGDIIDRGPRIRESLHIVKNMVDANTAVCVMGNHEFNALGYVTPTAETEGSGEQVYVRKHNQRHNHIIAETLQQFAPFPEEWRLFLEWFRGLPLFYETDDFRVVHACWDQALVDEYHSRGGHQRFDKDFIQKTVQRDSFEGKLVNRLTRGTDLKLPDGRIMEGKDGFQRRMFRTKFWAESPKTFQDVAFQPDPLPPEVARIPLDDGHKAHLLDYPSSAMPVFVGHYWLQGRPAPLRANVACLDYSAVKYGRMVAYRFDGESSLCESKFEWVYVEPDSNAH